MASDIVIRPGTADDVPFLSRMLYVAYYWDPRQAAPSFEEFLGHSEVMSRFVDGWGREGDRAIVAEMVGTPVGAAWYRRLRADNAGYSFVDESIPCLAIGVCPEYRGRGIGSLLLNALIDQARLDGFAEITLAVEVDNPAVHLYLRHDFRHDGEINGYYRMRANCQ